MVTQLVRRFCSKCGKSIDREDKSFYNANYVCKQCYNDSNPLFAINDEYIINFCRQCGDYSFENEQVDNDYKNSSGNILKDIGNAFYNNILKRVPDSKNIAFDLEFDKESLKQSNQNYVNLSIIGNAKKGVNAREKQDSTKIIIKNNMCPKCVKIRGKRFDAVIQIRVLPLKSMDINAVQQDLINYTQKLNKQHRSLFITDLNETTNGFDLKLSSKSLINKIRSYMNTKYHLISRSSSKLIGKDQETGKDKYRPYLLLKIVPIVVGDIIQQRIKRYQVIKITANRVHFKNMKTDEILIKRLDFLERRNIKIM